MLIEIFIISLLIGLNAFFALSEMAIVSTSKPLLRQYAKNGKKSAAIALNLTETSTTRFLSTVQVGITLIGTLAGAYGGATIAERLETPFNHIPFIAPNGEALAVFLVVTIITYFSVVIGELVPKQLALNNPERFAMIVAQPMALVSKACTPLVVLLSSSGAILMRIMRITPKIEGVTEAEINAVIAEGVASGAIEDEEHDVIKRVIRLGDRDVQTVMTHRTDVNFIDISDSFEDVWQKIMENGHSQYPVIDKDTTNVLGIVEARDVIAKVFDPTSFSVKKMIKNIQTISENTSCLTALNIFRSKNLHMAAVIDEYGSFEGLFTTSDLMEAIVGMMPSNYDVGDDPLIFQRDDGSWLVDGLTPIDEIHMTIGLEEISSTAEYQTVAGFILSELQSEPKVGGTVETLNHKFEIIDMDKHRIDKVLITALS